MDIFMLGLLIVVLYFLPTAIALKKNHPQKIPIIIINIFTGWIGGIGWVVALAWCFIIPQDKKTLGEDNNNHVASEIKRLHDLQKTGALTQEEFDAKKKKLLES